jgi:hypothetical protein
MGPKPKKDLTRKDPRAERNPAKVAVESVTEPETQPEILTEEWQKATAEKAQNRGWIYLDELAYLLAHDVGYDALIPELWSRYQLNLRGPKNPDVKTVQNRVGIWIQLLDRWAFGRVGGVPRKTLEPYSRLEDIRYIDLYRYDRVNGKLVGVRNRTDASINYLVTLEDLREYLTNRVRIPIPQALYPEKKGEKEHELAQLPQEIPPPEPSHAPVLQAKTPMPFPSPEASWKDITMTGREDYTKIHIKNNSNGTSGVFSYEQLGMIDKKTKKYNTDWMLLYGIIANSGETPAGYRSDEIKRNKASRLNKCLRNAFGIRESVWVNKKDMKRDALKRSCYIAKFQTRKGSAFQPSCDTPNEYEEIFQDAQQKSSYQSLD